MKKKQLDLGDLESVEIKPTKKKVSKSATQAVRDPQSEQVDLLDYTKEVTAQSSPSKLPIILLTLLCLALLAGLGYVFWQQMEMQKTLEQQELERKAAFMQIDETIKTQLDQLGGLNQQLSEAEDQAKKKLNAINASVEGMQKKLREREATLNASFDSAKAELTQLEQLLKDTETKAAEYASSANQLSATITGNQSDFSARSETILQSLDSAKGQAAMLKQEIKVQSQLFEENTQVFKKLQRQVADLSKIQSQLQASIASQNRDINEINSAINAFDAYRREVNQRLLSLEFKNGNPN